MAVLSYWGEFGSDECRKESKRNNNSMKLQSYTDKKIIILMSYNGNS